MAASIMQEQFRCRFVMCGASEDYVQQVIGAVIVEPSTEHKLGSRCD
jgi:hypothetical protein